MRRPRSTPTDAARTPDERRTALRLGHEAEAWVAGALEAQGWSVIGRNVRVGGGELDVVVARAGVVRFVEVKARIPGVDGLESVTPAKQRLLRQAAEAWLQACVDPISEAAFLVALVTLDDQGWTLELFDDAF